jgi:hypothetical protein
MNKRLERRGIRMNRKIVLSAFLVFSLTMGFTHIAKGQVGGLPVPVITQAFAAKEGRPEVAWKIYLNVSNPNGEMKNIYAIVDQAGVGQYPVAIIPVKEGNRKELSGYIYLPGQSQWSQFEFVYITLTVQVQDQSGAFSSPAAFQLKFSSRAKEESPPQGVFKEQEIGPIMVRLRTIDGGGGGRPPFGGR